MQIISVSKIKKRLIEYLAVVRLKEVNADKEAQDAATISAIAGEPTKQTETVAPIEAETTGLTFQ